MVKQILSAGLMAGSLLAGTAFAQTTAINDQQRDVNQQQRIEQGLQSGQLSTREGGQLERGQQAIDRQQAKDLRNGSISPQEQAKLNSMQNRESGAIYADKHNGVTGNPGSASSQRMQSDVQRNVNQQQRIENGVKDGQLTTREASQLEQGQAHVDRMEQHDLKKGPLTSQEQAQIQHAENVQSRDVYRDTHNGATQNPNSASSRRMANDVQRNVNQEQRIDQGVRSGSLNDKQVAHLQGREAHVDHEEHNAGANGHVNRGEQRHIQRTENRDSRAIHRQKKAGG